MEPIIDHIQITVRDLAVAVPFYDRFLPLLGFDPRRGSTAVIEDHEFHVVEYVHPRPPSSCVQGGITCRGRSAVHWLKAIGAVIVSEPRNYPEYTPQPYYAVFFKDLEGIKYEIVCTRAE